MSDDDSARIHEKRVQENSEQVNTNKLTLKVLDARLNEALENVTQRLYSLELRINQIELSTLHPEPPEDNDLIIPQWGYDLIGASIAALHSQARQGANVMALQLEAKYFGGESLREKAADAVVTSGTLYSAGKVDAT